MIVSIFNDVVGPVMRGPSSSHCAAALRIGRFARALMDGRMDRVLLQMDKAGSLPATHQSQGSDMGLCGGLLDLEAADDRLPDSPQLLADAGIELSFEEGDFSDPHPNTYRLTLSGGGTTRRLIAISTGGGMFEVIEIDGFPVSLGGDYDETLVWFDSQLDVQAEAIREAMEIDEVALVQGDSRTLVHLRSGQTLTDADLASQLPIEKAARIDRVGPVLPVRSRRDLQVPFRTAAELLAYDAGNDSPLWKLAIDYEMARSGWNESQVIDRMCDIVRIVRHSVEAGLEGTEYADRVLGYQSGGYRQAMENVRLVDVGVLNRITLMVTALMEVKSSMGVIVAAPTAGACAAFPAVCLTLGEKMAVDDVEIAKAMLAGGLVGVFIAAHWSFAAEVGGCQAEGGSAAAMSAAAVVSFMHGGLSTSLGAASMAMQNMLGLICDPVANRVEVPCLGKNVLAASNALMCANMSLAGFDPVIPLDETIAAAKSVAERMPREHRCTALGGLSTTPTSIAIEKRLQNCGGCGPKAKAKQEK